MSKKPIVALLYDFDSTLSTSDMQAFGFIPAVGMTPKQFWDETDKFANANGCERTLAYMYTMCQIAKEKGIKMTKEWLNEMGKNIEFYPGVLTWFKRINEFGKEHNIEIEHYLVSSGNQEIVEGCKIAKEFKVLFACQFYFGKDGTPEWPKLAINYTQKTQYFYRISKGVFDVTNDVDVNKKNSIKRIPCSNIIYIGDGMTDIPTMITVKNAGGKAIAVFPKNKSETAEALLKEDRVNYICEADYTKGSAMEKLVELIVMGVEINESLKARAGLK